MRLFVVCGPESSGNRLVAGYLHRSGVVIDSSSSHQDPAISTTADEDVGLIVHHQPKLSRAVMTGQRAGRNVLMVVLTREVGALIASMVDREHVDSKRDALERVRLSHMAAMDVAIRFDLDFVVVSYESLVLHPRETVGNMLRTLELPMVGLDDEIVVQRRKVSPIPRDRNQARYA